MLKRIIQTPEVPLRLGLGLTYLYSGLGLIRNPIDWSGFAPLWFINMVESVLTVETFFRIQGAVELLVGLMLFAWFVKPKALFVVTIVGTLQIAAILLLSGVDFVTFRDMGLFGAWLALMSIARQKIYKPAL